MEAIHTGSIGDNRVKEIVDDSLRGFKDEVIKMLVNGFQELSVTNPGPTLSDRPPVHREHTNEQEGEDVGSSLSRNEQYGHRDQNRVFTSWDIDRNSEKVLNIIRNWRIRFTGDTSEVTADEFIYRINTLTVSNLHSDFNILC